MSEVRGYLPPEGARNAHGIPHQYNEGQGAHRVSNNAVAYGPEALILTATEGVIKEAERYGYEEVPQEVAEEALEAWNGDGSREEREEAVANVVEAYQAEGQEEGQEADAAEGAGQEDAQDPEESEDAEEAPAGFEAIPPRDILEGLNKEAGPRPTVVTVAEGQGIDVGSKTKAELIQELEDLREERGD